MENRTVTFPYASMDQAIQDKFAKIGGPSEAFRFLSNGYKQTFWRKDSQDRRNTLIKRLLAEERAREKRNGTKTERQLGRTPEGGTK